MCVRCALAGPAAGRGAKRKSELVQKVVWSRMACQARVLFPDPLHPIPTHFLVGMICRPTKKGIGIYHGNWKPFFCFSSEKSF